MIPADSPHFERLRDAALALGAKVVSFGKAPHADVRLLDSVAASNGGSLVTADMHVRYLGRPRTDTVSARSRIVRLGSQLIVVECKVVDLEAHVIASADFSMMRVPLRRPLSPGVEGRPGDPEL